MTVFAEVGAIYFDLDDTLCGYWSACDRALREIFLEVPVDDREALLDHWSAALLEVFPLIKHADWSEGYLKSGKETRDETMRKMLLRVSIDDPSLAERLGDLYKECRNSHLELFPDTLSVLESLLPRYPLGLITNGPAEIQRMEIAKLGIEGYFKHIFIEGEMRIGKPAPEVFARAAEAVSLPASKVLFVGNSYRHDILPAIKAGFKTVWIRRQSDVPPSSGRTAKPEAPPVKDPAPDAVIGELSELLQLLG